VLVELQNELGKGSQLIDLLHKFLKAKIELQEKGRVPYQNKLRAFLKLE